MTTGDATARCRDEAAPSTPLERVRALLAEVEAEAEASEEILALVASLVANNAALQRQLAELGGKRFRSSEIVSSAQLRLLLKGLVEPEQLDGPAEQAKANEQLTAAAKLDEYKHDRDEKKKRKKHKRPAVRPFPAKLRRVDNPIPVPKDQRTCPKCACERVCVGQDVAEVLDRVPAEVIVRIDRREKLACKTPGCEGSVCRAPLPDKVVSGGRFGVGLVACIVVDKYRDGLPLHRQAERYRRLGIDLPLSTLVDQVRHVADLAAVLQEVALEEVLTSHVMHLDGTGLPVLDELHTKGKRLGTLWAYVGDGKVSAYLFNATGRKRGQREDEDGRRLELGPEDVLARRKGLVVADASNLFDASFKRDDLIECGCNAHGRRGFVKALDRGDSRAALPIGAYRRLYEYERKARALSNDERRKIRQHESRPVFDALLRWCQAYAPYEPPSSPLGAALRYFINHHEALGRFLGDGAIPIDNSLVERQHVRVALTRKNFYFAGSDAGGDRAAVIYTLLGCCALNRIDPEPYLLDVLPRLLRGVTRDEARDLLPHRWTPPPRTA